MNDLNKSKNELIEEINSLRKRLNTIEAENKKEKQYFGEIFDRAPLSYQSLDQNSCFLNVNQAWLETLGYKKEEVIGKWFGDFLTPGFQELFKKNFPRFKSAGRIEEVEYDMIHKKGHVVSVSIDGRIAHDQDGNFIRTHCILQDITERKLSEEALRESENRYQSLFENSAIPIWEEDFSEVKAYIDNLYGNGISDFRAYFEEHPAEVVHCAELVKILDINFVSLEIFEVKSKSDLLIKLSSYFNEDSYSVFKEELIALAEGQMKFESEISILDLSGNTRILLLKLSVNKGCEETLSRVLVSTMDITERKRMEKELRLSEQQLSSHLQNTPIGAISLDMDFKVVEWNPAAEAIFGYTREESLGKHASQLVVPENMKKLTNGIFLDLLSERGGTRSTNENITKEGKRIIGDWYNTTLKDANGNVTGFASLVNDITKIKQAELEITQQAEDLTLINKLNKAANCGASFAEIIELICTSTKKLFDCFGASLFILDNKKEHLILQNVSIPVSLRKTIKKLIGIKIPDVIIPLNKSKFYNNILIGKQPKIINDEKLIRQAIEDTVLTQTITNKKLIKIINKTIPAIQKLLQIKSMMIIPLYMNEEAIGLIDISGKNYFNETDLQRFFTIASQFTGIFQRKQIEENLQLSEERFRGLSEAAFEAIFISEKSICLEQNLTAEKMFGYSSTEAIGRSGAEWFVPKDRDMVMKNILSGYEESYEAKALCKDGTTFPAEIHAKMTHYKGRNVRITALRDITKRKQAEKKLKQLSAMVEQSTEGMAQADIEGNLLFVNRAWCEMHGYKNYKSLLSKNLTIFHNKEQIENDVIPFNEKVKKNGTYSGEVGHITKEGKIFPTLMTTTLLKDSQGNPFAIAGIAKDITERKQAEEELRDSEERFRNMFETNHAIMLLIEPITGKINDANPAACEYYGYSHRKFINELYIQNINTLSDKEVKNEMQAALKAKRNYFIFKHKLANGIVRDVEVYSSKTLIKGKELLYSIIHDITERKQAEQALRENESKLRNIVEHSTNLFYTHSVDHQLTYLSPQTRQFFDCEPHEAMVKWTNFITDNPVNEIGFQNTVKAINTGKPQPPYPLELIGNKGKVIWVEVHEAPLVENGKTVSIVGALVDITERRNAEDLLRESEEKFRNVIQQSTEGISLVDEKGIIIEWNPSLEKISGLPASKTIGKPIWEVQLRLNPPEKQTPEFKRQIETIIRGIIKSGKIPEYFRSMEHELLLPDGTIRYQHGSVFSIKTNKGYMLSSIARDITEHKQVDEEIKKSREQLRMLTANIQNAREDERTSIAREIHDELGQVLTALKMDFAWFKKRLQPDEKILFEKIDSMRNLVNDSIQNVKRISSNLRPGILDDLGLVATMEWQVNDFISRTSIKCDIKINPKDLTVNKLLSTSIFRILQEALTNIARHAKATKVEIRFKKDFNGLKLKIKDNGKGLSQKQIEDTKTYGLQGIKERVEYFNGSFNIKSVENKGTTLLIKLPMSDEEM